jgi:multiple sugar transport system permease protein
MHMRRNVTAYFFLAPFLLLFIVFIVVPIVLGLWISLHTWNPILPTKPFVGLDNYVALFTPGTLTGDNFWQSMGATGIFTAATFPLMLAIPLALASLLNRNIKGGSAFRSSLFAPYVLGVAVVGVMWNFFLNPQLGVVNAALQALGFEETIPWTSAMPWAWVSLIAVTVWWTAGFNTVILLAGMKGINPELFDAAAIDGAGAWAKFWHITLPGLRPVMLFVTTLTVISSANMFGQSFLITQGGPGDRTKTVIMYIAEEGLANQQMGPAAAMSYILFAFLAIISVINFRVQREK